VVSPYEKIVRRVSRGIFPGQAISVYPVQIMFRFTLVSGNRKKPPMAAIKPVPKKMNPTFPPRLPVSGLIFTEQLAAAGGVF
jgi:hypothetical protein